MKLRLSSLRLAWALASGTAVVALSGCGGGGSTDAPPALSDSVPESASASWAAYTQYTASLAPDDGKEPLKLDKVAPAPPATDTDEPMDL
ncbi:hypothetical protein [Methylibium rhizosphaerae]|uniref:hypothetical protein n=1 Tax=Methylibium rhizosphaerae TaxID=2570323 RepID=UPI00112C3B5A|nr:hypothetical protein [Methylibium rhizosphaerae]